MIGEWTFPWPPTTTNRMYRVGRGVVRMDSEARDYKMRCALVVQASGATVQLHQRLRLAVFIYPPANVRPDWDNCMKLVQDAVFLGLGGNDYWVVEAHVYRAKPAGEGHIDVKLEEATWTEMGEIRG